MAATYPAYKVGVAHVAPVLLDLEATVGKACSLVDEMARNGAQLIAFPETYIPAFPIWCALRAPIYNHELFRRLAANSMRVPGPELARIAKVARERGVVVSLGVNEGNPASVGCIWNTNLLLGEDGSVLNHHRKIVPTFYEKLVWAPGDGAGLRVEPTRLGKIGMLICGENTNPLARFSLLAQGEQVHISTYPPAWPTHDPDDGGNYNLHEAIRIRAGAHAFEGKLFNVVAAGYLDRPSREKLASLIPEADRILDASPRGVSMVIGPTGEIVGEARSEDEGILYVDVDLAQCVEPKQYHDIVGGYNRFDIFKLTVDRTAQRPVSFRADPCDDATDETQTESR